jgi:hypothetical protein
MIFTKEGLADLALMVMVTGFVTGAVIGIVAAALAFRSRYSIGRAIGAGILGGIAFDLATYLSGWAGTQSPASWLRMTIAQHGEVIAVIGSSLAALLVGAKKPKVKNERPA